MTPDEPQDEQGGGEYQSPAYLNQTQFSRPRPANGGDFTQSNGGQYPALGPSHLLSTSRPPQPRAGNGGGAAFFAPQAAPGQDAGGAIATAIGSTSAGNGGAPNVVHTPYGGPFGNYSGNPQPPRPAAIPTGSPEITTPRQGEALDSFMASHQPQQGGGQQGGQQGQQADEAEAGGAAEGEAAEGAEAAESAGAGAGGAAEGLELAAAFL